MSMALAATTTPSPVSTSGFVTLKIGDQEYTLTGLVGHALIVDYHSEYKDAITLGTIDSIIDNVQQALGNVPIKTIYTGIKSDLSGAGKPLSNIAAALTTANIRITDIGINTTTNTYRFGFAVDLTTSVPRVAIAGIELEAFGLLLKHTPTTTTTTTTGTP